MKSIIGHTTTCPYCGHRILPKNLDKHVQTQHFEEAEQERFSRAVVRSGFIQCKYCHISVETRLFEQHMREVHPDAVWIAEKTVEVKEKKESLVKANRLKLIAEKFDAEIVIEKPPSDSSVPYEWREAERNTRAKTANASSQNTKNSNHPQKTSSVNLSNRSDLIRCPACKSFISQEKIVKHILKAHPYTPHQFTETNGKSIYCPFCKKYYDTKDIAQHFRSH